MKLANEQVGYPPVKGVCPACGNKSLFLGSEGHITCSIDKCPDPCRAGRIMGDGDRSGGERRNKLGERRISRSDRRAGWGS